MGGIFFAMSVCMLIQPAGELLLAEDTRIAVARLLVVRTLDETVKVYECAPVQDSEPAERQEVPLSPLMYLFAGDEMEIPEEVSVVLLCYADNTRQRHFGPARLLIDDGCVTVLEQSGAEPEIEEAHVLTAPLEVGDRVSRRGAASVLRSVSDDVPVPLCPDNIKVLPGEVSLRWIYTGADEQGTLMMHDSAGAVVFTAEVTLAAYGQVVDVESGETYFWWVDPPGGGGVPAFFTVLAEEEYEQVRAALTACGLPDADPIEALMASESIDDLAYLVAVFQCHSLQQEADAAIERLAAFLELGQ